MYGISKSFDGRILARGQDVEDLSKQEARQLLEDYGIQFNEKTFVAYGAHLDLAKLFLRAGMKVNAVVDFGTHGQSFFNDYEAHDNYSGGASALMVAADDDEAEETVRYLLDHGASPLKLAHWQGTDHVGEKTRTALCVAIRAERSELFEILVNAVQQWDAASAAIHLTEAATEEGEQLRLLGLLYDAGMRSDERDAGRILCQAARLGAAENIEYLLDRLEFDPNASYNGPDSKRFHRGDTPLMLAAANGNARGVEILLEAGADVDATNAKGWTALMYAAESGRERAMIPLLRAGIDARAKNSDGLTALMIADNGSGQKKSSHVITRALQGELDEYIREQSPFAIFDVSKWSIRFDVSKWPIRESIPTLLGLVLAAAIFLGTAGWTEKWACPSGVENLGLSGQKTLFACDGAAGAHDLSGAMVAGVAFISFALILLVMISISTLLGASAIKSPLPYKAPEGLTDVIIISAAVAIAIVPYALRDLLQPTVRAVQRSYFDLYPDAKFNQLMALKLKTGDYEAAELLLEAGASARASVSPVRTIVDIAVGLGDLRALRMLLDRRNDVADAEDTKRAYLAAARSGRVELTIAFVEAGADPLEAMEFVGSFPELEAALMNAASDRAP